MTDVTLPDGRVATFPDTMSPDEIKAVLAKKFPTPAAPTEKPKEPGFWDWLKKEFAPESRPQQIENLKEAGSKVNDAVRVAANEASLGLADRLAASTSSGTYDENLKKEREKSQAAEESLGDAALPAKLAGSIGGGLVGSAALRAAPLVGGFFTGARAAGAPAAARYGAAAAEGALFGGASGAGHVYSGDPMDYVENGFLGAGLGAGLGTLAQGGTDILSRVMRGVFQAPSATYQRRLQTLENEGVPISAGLRTGNPMLRLAEDIAGKRPLGGPNLNADTMEEVTRAGLRRSGVHAPRGSDVVADDVVLGRAFDHAGNRINSIQSRYPVQVDQQFLNDIAAVDNMIPGLMERGTAVQRFVDRMSSQPTWSPEEAQLLRTQLLTAIRGERGPSANYEVRRALSALQNSLDEALERQVIASGPVADINTLREARRHYANTATMADAISRSGGSGDLGVLTPSALRNATAASQGKRNAVLGRGNMTDLGAASRPLLKSPPDSFTNTREGVSNPVRWLEGLMLRAGVNNPLAQRFWSRTLPPGARHTGYASENAVPVREAGELIMPEITVEGERRARGGHLSALRGR